MMFDYDSIATVYARHRKASPNVIDEIRTVPQLHHSSRVLEVGCGTASHLMAVIDSTGCRGWGIEPSEGMRRQAPSHERLTVVDGCAQDLPFADGFFDVVFSVNVIHHVSDRPAHYREARRVMAQGGMICTVTDSTEMIRKRKPLSQYWPTSAEADIKRYPTVDSLLDQMHEAGFVDLVAHEIRTPVVVRNATPFREKAFSCLHMISDAEFQAGLDRLESDLRNGPVDGLSEFVCIWGKAPELARRRNVSKPTNS
jgi:SAM-dependent methyltransferase